MRREQIDLSDPAVRPPRPPAPPWSKIEQDYFAVHERRWARIDAEFEESDGFSLSDGQEQRRAIVERGFVLVRQILDLVVAEPIPGVRDAAVRYLLNRDFAWPEGMGRLAEPEELHCADTERNELRPQEFQCYSTCEAVHGRERKESRP